MCRKFGIGGYGQDKGSERSNSSNGRVPAQTNGKKKKEDMFESEILAEMAKGLQSSPLGQLYSEEKGE